MTVPHLIQDSVTKRLSYRRIYPANLRPYIPGNRKHLKRSLQATDITASEALAIYTAADAEYEATVAAARKRLEGRFDTLDPMMVTFLADRFKVEWLAADSAKRMSGDTNALEMQKNGIEFFLSDFRKWRAWGETDEIVERWQNDAQRLLDGEALWLDPSDPDRLDGLCIAINSAAIEACLECLARLKDKGAVTSPVAPIRAPEAPIAVPIAAPFSSKGMLFEDIGLAYLERTRQPLSTSSKESLRTALRYFQEAHGSISVDAITVAKVNEWLDLMAARPSTLPAADREMSLRALKDRYASQPDVKRMASVTQEKYVNSLSQCWKHAQSTGKVDAAMPNPFRGHQFPKARRSKAFKGYRINEIQAIFDLPLFHGEMVEGKYADAAYWLPLILLWTGARPEEAAQLMVSDFNTCPEEGGWTMEFTDEGVHPVKGQRNLKTSHNDSGHRIIPVPHTLLDLGLLAYLEMLKAAGHKALFPTLGSKAERGLLFTNYGKWWARHVEKAGILEADHKVSRDMRHSWNTAAIESGIPEEAREYIMGHTRGKASSNFTYGERIALGKRIHDVQFRGLDLSEVLPWGPHESSSG